MSDDGVLTQQLEKTDLFAGLSKRALHRVERDGEVKDFEAGAVITAEGTPVAGFAAFSPTGAYFYLVLSGSGEVRHGDTVVISIGPGSYFGELSLIDGKPRSADVVAGPDGMTAFVLDKWKFEALLEEHPEVAIPMLRVMTARLRAAEAVR
ncbi:MAG: Crp/Fnr family transcriptional regulator [Candidatus Nanopelagicales bacterium]